MSLPPQESPALDQIEDEQAAIKALVNSYAKSNLQDAQDDLAKATEKHSSEPHSMRVYTREQLLYLCRSPLVQLPPNMPELKQWFGDNEILLAKKESDSNANGRGRFRREVDEGDASSRFRSTTSQPSQMGNFKHQSLRSGDRDRDREREGDRDREIRDKEGLRHLSDKYDRDRLGMLPASARGKERESAPHLSTNSSNRNSSQNQSSVSNRRTDGRESQKKRTGEIGDDWRRNDPARADRDDRERARSKARESSRSRRSPSRSRRERDDGKDRLSKSDRDRDDYKRDDYKRERDAERDQDDDPRRWRDDGKRDDRMVARRAERDRELRTRERGDHWEPSSDRRWTSAEERDGRYKRSSGRDRKSGGNGDEPKDREERREREREKEKEPAWMETYVPTSTSGILGGKSADGELDGIQAWKKGLKEKELQEKSAELSESDGRAGQELAGKDEIQIFKMLMKREEEKKKTDSNPPPPGADSTTEAKLVTDTADQTHAQPRALSSSANFESSGIISPPLKDSVQKHGSTAATPAPEIPLVDEPPVHLLERSSDYNPPAGSRLLALGRTSARSPVNPLSGSSSGTSNALGIEAIVKPGTPRSQGFSPFEEQQHRFEEEHTQLVSSGQFELGQRPLDKSYNAMPPSSAYDDTNGLTYAGNRGSRFAKFFDNKAKENALPGLKPQTPTGFLSSSPDPPLGQEQTIYGGVPPPHQERTVDELFAMLNNSSQAQRANLLNHPTPHHPLTNGILNQANALSNLPSQPQHLQSNSRLDALYDSRLDDRFVPDGMVPGLRTAPPRSRDNVGLYHELPDEALHFHLQRLQQQQQRGPDSFSGPNPSMYNPQSGRNMGLPPQPAQFRGGPSPGLGPHTLSGLQHQRLPPGLANLGGRPPHDPAQILGPPGHSAGPFHPILHPNAPPSHQQPLNSFVGNNINFNNPQLRGPIANLHPLQNTGPHPGLGHIGLGNNMEFRSQHPNQILGAPGIPVPRGGNPMFNPQQTTNHLQGPPLGRQQAAHLPPQVPPHLMPPHFQQGANGPNNGHTNELIALLMGGAPRE